MPHNNFDSIKSNCNPKDYDWKHFIDNLLYISSDMWVPKRVKMAKHKIQSHTTVWVKALEVS